MSSVTAWIYTVKEVYSTVNRLQNVCRCADSHQIRRFVLRQMRYNRIQNPVHLFMCFSDRKSADRITIQIKLCNLLCMADTDIFIDATLVNSKKHLLLIDRIRKTVQTVHLCLTAFQPSGCPVNRFFHIISFCNTRRTFIKCHCYCRRKIRLNLHTFLRSHKNLVPVYMGVEINSFFFDSSESCQRKNLKPAGICKDWLIPGHKFMKTAQLFHNFISRTHMEMIRI